MEIKSTAIIGMGALGMMYGTHMLDAGEKNVWFVMDEARVQKYGARTFYKNDKSYQLPMKNCEEMNPADLVIVAVKYNALPSALETMRKCVGEHTVILSVMNGITSEEIIGERYGKEHMIYTVAHGMDVHEDGRAADRSAGSVPGEKRKGSGSVF